MNDKIIKRMNLLMASGNDHLAQAIALLSGYRAGLEYPNAKCPHSGTCCEGWEWQWAYNIGCEARMLNGQKLSHATCDFRTAETQIDLRVLAVPSACLPRRPNRNQFAPDQIVSFLLLKLPKFIRSKIQARIHQENKSS